jgi:tartronate-semialdehyde synthase
MAKMRAVDAAVLVLEKEGVDCAFGVPGAAINPFYSALKARGSIAISWRAMSRAPRIWRKAIPAPRHGNIGVCIGTSGPAGTDMITGLYSAQADSIPILCITGQAPRARLTRRIFRQSTSPVDRGTARQMGGDRHGAGAGADGLPEGVPYDALRPSRSGADRPAGRRAAGRDRVRHRHLRSRWKPYKPKATRAQAEKALQMLNDAERPLIVAGGGIINANASDLLVNSPRSPAFRSSRPDGLGRDPRRSPLMAGMCGLQTIAPLRQCHGAGIRLRDRHRQPLGQPSHRQSTYTKDRKFVHVDIEPTQIGRVFAPDFGIVSDAGAGAEAADRRRDRVEGPPAS